MEGVRFEDVGSREQPALLRLVVVGPPTASAARALDPDGDVLADLALSEGVAVVPFPEGTATVATLAPDGTVLQRTSLLTTADLGD